MLWVGYILLPLQKKCLATRFEIGTLRERVFRWLRNSGQKRQGQTWGLCEGAESDTFRVLFVLFCFWWSTMYPRLASVWLCSQEWLTFWSSCLTFPVLGLQVCATVPCVCAGEEQAQNFLHAIYQATELENIILEPRLKDLLFFNNFICAYTDTPPPSPSFSSGPALLLKPSPQEAPS